MYALLASGFNKSALFELQRKAVFSILGVLSEVCATLTRIGLDFKLTISPCFLWFGKFSFAVEAFDHDNP